MKDFHYDEDNVSINPETFESAKDYFNLFREKGIHWKEMSNIKKACAYLQWLLQNIQETNLMDIEDVLLEMYMKVHRHGTIRDFSEMAVDAISRGGSAIKTDASPAFVELIGHMNNDDLQDSGSGLEVENDMSSVSTPDVGPGSDLQIAKIDIEDQLGEKYLDVFEAKFSGATKREIEIAFGYSYEEVRWCEQRVHNFLKQGEYTLDGTNRRLGSSKEFDSGKSFFPASRKTQRTWRLPNVDHRSTSYTAADNEELKPIPPCGDEIPNTGYGYELCIGVDNLHPDDAKK